MILADKILSLRRSNGWSQEELAEKLDVSRQSVSKWESAQAIPDINKIIQLSKVFAVTTDYLLNDEIEQAAYTDNDEHKPSGKRVSLDEANAYMSRAKKSGKIIGIGVMLCILAPIALIVLGGIADAGGFISENLAAGIGIGVLLLMVSAAVVIFIMNDQSCGKYAYLKKGEFELDYGVSGIVKEKKNAFSGKNTLFIAVGVVLCILACSPLIISALAEASDIVILSMVGVLLAVISVAVYMFIYSSSINESFNALLKEEECAPEYIKKNKPVERFGGVFWPCVTAGYLIWSFVTGDWNITWIIWPVAALIFAGISAAIKKDD